MVRGTSSHASGNSLGKAKAKGKRTHSESINKTLMKVSLGEWEVCRSHSHSRVNPLKGNESALVMRTEGLSQLVSERDSSQADNKAGHWVAVKYESVWEEAAAQHETEIVCEKVCSLMAGDSGGQQSGSIIGAK